VIARIVEEKKFAEIAHELQLPLGTVLTRMRAALAKLKLLLNREDP
jgi:DNA-directed RNA polymerase specialized sigma24 family protein